MRSSGAANVDELIKRRNAERNNLNMRAFMRGPRGPNEGPKVAQTDTNRLGGSLKSDIIHMGHSEAGIRIVIEPPEFAR